LYVLKTKGEMLLGLHVVMTNFTRPDANDILDDFNRSPERRALLHHTPLNTSQHKHSCVHWDVS
jgi:hypothetical protein